MKAPLIALFLFAPLMSDAAVVTSMTTSTFGGYDQTFTPGGNFIIFPQANTYYLDNATSWQSGAGSHPYTFSRVASTLTTGLGIIYSFQQPANGILFQNTDFDSGNHSAQGVLTAPTSLVISAQIGSSTGTMKGYTTIASNIETNYGQPRFNYYAAPVGTSVYFETTFVLKNGHTWNSNTFASGFDYNLSGVVDFTRVVPEPASTSLFALGIISLLGKRNRSRPEKRGGNHG